jgi:NodT family efflux transporter outer membrane factor (OMF) lipoprotein
MIGLTSSSLRARAMAGVAVFFLVSCRVGPNYRPPALPEGAAAPLVGVNAALETPTPPPDAWWHLYNDPRLDALVEEALQANRDLAAADANLTAARAVVAEVHARRYPSTDVTAAAVRGRDPGTDEILELTGRPPQTIWLYEDLFQVAYEVDLFGRIHRAIEAANANAESVAAARDSVRVVVAASTARSYAAVCALGEELDVARHSLEVVSHEAEITEQRYAAGAGSEFDVTRARALVGQVRSSIPQLEGERKAALFELTAVLGRTPTNAPRELEKCVTPPRVASLIPVGDGRTLISRRPDVRQAEDRLAAATAQIGVATADLFPTIHLTGFYGGAATEPSQLTTSLGLVWGIGPSISWAFPNQAGPRARVRQAKASQAAALAAFDSVVLTALKETEQALAQYSAALDRRQALADAQEEIHRSFDIAHEEYAAGSVSNLDLLTTEQSLVALDAAVASSDTSLIQLQIDVFKALGGGWHNESLRSP